MSREKIAITIKAALTTMLVPAVFIPYAAVYMPADSCVKDDCWQQVAVIDDALLITLYIPYAAACLIYFWKFRLPVLRVIIVVLSALFMLNCVFSMLLPAQDFVPLPGVLIVLALHCCIFLLSAFENRILKWIGQFFTSKTRPDTEPQQ